MVVALLAASWAAVVGLFSPCGPAAIGGRVIAIVVDAVKRMTSRRLRTNIGQEGWERRAPVFAHTNTAPTVIRPVFGVGIFAAVDDVTPRDVFAAVRKSMRSVARNDGLSLQTTATAMVACSQVSATGHDVRAALATALPHRCGASGASAMHNKKTTKAPSGQINERWHMAILARNSSIVTHIPAW